MFGPTLILVARHPTIRLVASVLLARTQTGCKGIRRCQPGFWEPRHKRKDAGNSTDYRLQVGFGIGI